MSANVRICEDQHGCHVEITYVGQRITLYPPDLHQLITALIEAQQKIEQRAKPLGSL